MSNSELPPFARRLRELRAAANMTGQELAEAAGLTRQGVALLETGRRQPTWQTVQALADALGVGLELFRENPEKSGNSS